MTSFLIGAAELEALIAGQPGIVAALDFAEAGLTGHGLSQRSSPLMVLRPRDGVLRCAGEPEGVALPMPPGIRPLAILASDPDAAAGLAAGLPADVPRLVGVEALPRLIDCLADALLAAEAGRRRVAGPASRRPPAPGPARAAASAPQIGAAVPDIAAGMAPSGADFLDLRLHQHSLNADGSYRHLDLGLIGLASAAGIWREARLKLFDRRGTIGMEFRNIRGWPRMFDPWPEGGSDRYGPFWRLEDGDVRPALGGLGSLQNRALVAALLEVLPAAARQAADLAELPQAEQDHWATRGRSLAAAVAAAVATSTASPVASFALRLPATV